MSEGNLPTEVLLVEVRNLITHKYYQQLLIITSEEDRAGICHYGTVLN